MKTFDLNVQKRYDAFWNGEAIDRFLTYVVVGNGNHNYLSADMSDEEYIRQKWKNIDARVKKSCEDYGNATYYLDGFPTQFVNFGPGSLAPTIGGNYQFAKNTVWFDCNPIITDWEHPPVLNFNPENDLWQMTLEMTDKILDAGTAYASIADLGGTLDIVASLRGSENLLYDLYDYPDEIKAASKRVNELWKHAYTVLANRTLARQDGTTSWMPVWCRGRYAPLQCDFSAMISPDMFAEFVLPDLKDLTEFLDNSIYHLDGIGEIPHLDHILSIPRLNAIQWTSGDGRPPVTDECWFEMYDKIQAAGKGLVLFADSDTDRLEKLLNHISPRGVFLSVGGCNHEKARYITDMIEKIGLGK